MNENPYLDEDVRKALGMELSFASWLEQEYPEVKLMPLQDSVARVFFKAMSGRGSGKSYLLRLMVEFERRDT